MTERTEAAIHRTLGQLESGLSALTDEVRSANKSFNSLTERVAALETWRTQVQTIVLVIATIGGAIWAIVKLVI